VREKTLIVHSTREKLHSPVGLDENVYNSMEGQAALTAVTDV